MAQPGTSDPQSTQPTYSVVPAAPKVWTAGVDANVAASSTHVEKHLVHEWLRIAQKVLHPAIPRRVVQQGLEHWASLVDVLQVVPVVYLSGAVPLYGKASCYPH